MFTLSKPIGNGTIPPGVFAYVGQKLKNDFYHFVMIAFQDSQLSQAELAIKTGIDRGQLSRLLSGPGNWTMDTVAKLLFAINGHVVIPEAIDVDEQVPANMTKPEWLFDAPSPRKLDSNLAPDKASTPFPSITVKHVFTHSQTKATEVSNEHA